MLKSLLGAAIIVTSLSAGAQAAAPPADNHAPMVNYGSDVSKGSDVQDKKMMKRMMMMMKRKMIMCDKGHIMMMKK